MRPRPTTPTVLSSSSTPEYLLRFHAPPLRAWLAGAMLRAVARSSPTASSAAEVMLEVGALTTMTPACVAAWTSTLSRPTPARAMTLRLLAGGDRLGVHLGGRPDEHRVDVGERGQQLLAVGSIGRADLEVGSERLDRGGRQLFGDEDNGLAHRGIPSGRVRGPHAGQGAGRRRHRDVPAASLGAALARITRCNQHVNSGSARCAVSVTGTSIPYAGRGRPAGRAPRRPDASGHRPIRAPGRARGLP